MAARPTVSRKIEELELLSSEASKDSELLVTLGEAYLRGGKVGEAVQAYARASELDPRTDFKTLYWEWLGLVRESRGELEGALEAYRRWLELEPALMDPVDKVATLLVVLQRWTDVVLLRPQYVKRLELGLDPKALESAALYGFVLEQLGSPEDVSCLDRTYAALEYDPDNISMRYLLGVLLYRSRHLEAAQAEFERVLALDEDETWREKRFALQWNAVSARLMLSRILRLQGRIGEAVALLKDTPLESDGVEAVREMAAVLLEAEEYDKVLELVTSCEEQRPALSSFTAEALLGLGKIAEAARILKAGFPVEGDSVGDAVKTAAITSKEDGAKVLQEASEYIQAGDLEGGRRLLESYLGEQPSDLETWRTLEQIYRSAGEPVLARLARIQAVKLQRQEELPSGCYWPAPVGMGCVGYCFQAVSLPGHGRLWVTGASKGVEELARLSMTLLRKRFEVLGLEDPSYRDLHLHVIRLDGEGEPVSVSEQAGAAVLVALGKSLCPGCLETGRVMVLGAFDLSGDFNGSAEVVEGWMRFYASGYRFDKVVLPAKVAPELLRLPPSIWVEAEVDFCEDVVELISRVVESAKG